MNKILDLNDWQEKFDFKKPKEKLKIYYTPEAFAKTIALVKAHAGEIGWNMIIKPYKDGYKVYDILVYPQKASPAFISVDLARYGLWKAKLDDEIEKALYGQGHSHVNMSTCASMVDVRQQHDEILTKKNGYYFFQIWNKHNEINSFFYDIDNKIYYMKNDIKMIIEEVDDFIVKSFDMIDFELPTFGFEAGEDFES